MRFACGSPTSCGICHGQQLGELVSDKNRIEFSQKTKTSIAAAVNWQCSAPLCNIPAMGVDDGKTINGGTACHIYSAAKNGPRGRGGLKDNELEDASNGLWCCSFHGRVIDSNNGFSFPAAQLLMWKRLAEGRIRRAMSVQYAELGWIHKFFVSVDTIYGTRWEFSEELHKNNLLRGGSGFGKSLLLEALGSISEDRHSWRIRAFPSFSSSLQYETLTRETVAKIHGGKEKSNMRSQGGIEFSLPPPDMTVMYLSFDHIRDNTDITGISRLMQILGVDEDTLCRLAKSVSSNPNSGMSISIKFENSKEDDSADDETNGRMVFVTLDRHTFELSFNGLSSSEQTQVAMALFIARAREEAKTRPVLLCMDALWKLDDHKFRHELSRLAEEPIQLLVIAPYAVTDEHADVEFHGWNLIETPSIQSVFDCSH